MEAQWGEKVRAWEEAYRRKQRIIVLSIFAVIALVVAVYFLYPVVKAQMAQKAAQEAAQEAKIQHYERGHAYLEEGDLAAAAEEFWLAGDYKDAQQHSGELNYDFAQQYLDEGKVTYAAVTFGKAGNYQDAREKAYSLWALFADRKVISSTHDVAGWINPDGTAEVLGNEVARSDDGVCDVSGWTDLVDIFIRNGLAIGLRSDGTAMYNTYNSNLEYVTTQLKWTDIVSIGFTYGHIVGIKADGSVKVYCPMAGQCTMEQTAANWTDVIDICGITGILVGLRADGTLIFANCEKYFEDTLGIQAFQEDLLNLENVVAIDNYEDDAAVIYLEDGSTRYLGAEYYFSEDYCVSLPKGLVTKEAPKHDLALIAAAFPDRRAQYYEKAQAYLEQGDIANAAMAFGKAKDYEDAAQQAAQLWKQVTPMPTFGIYGNAVVAVKQDGTLATAGNLPDELPEMEGVVGGTYNSRHGYALLNFDGTVSCSEDVYWPAWSNVVQITRMEDRGFLLALQADGTVRCTYGDYEFEYVSSYSSYIDEVANWVGIVDVAGGFEYICGLRSDGTVVMAGVEFAETDLSGWKDVVDIAVGGIFIYGCKSDGTVLVTKRGGVYPGEDHSFGQKVENWTDIVAIEATDEFVVGLKADGTMVIACAEEFREKQVLTAEVEAMEGLSVPKR